MTATLTAPPLPNTVTLTALAEATKNYLENEVEVSISDVTRNLNVHADGTFNVQVTNSTAERGVRLIDVTVHLEVGSGSVALLKPVGPAYLQFRATGSSAAPLLPANAEVPEVFVFFPSAPGVAGLDDILEPGESFEITMGYHAEGAGQTNLTAHIHAEVAFEDLFPRTNGTTARKSVTIGN